MSLFQRRIKDNRDIKKILIARADRLGDMILAIPAIASVHKCMPDAELYILANSYNMQVLKGFSYIKEIIELDKYSLEEAKNKIEDLKLDAFIALFSNSDIISLAKVSKARYRIGNLSKPSSFFAYNYGICQHRKKSLKNEAEYCLDLIMQLLPTNAALEVVKDRIAYFDDNRKVVIDFLRDNHIREKFIVLHPFCAGSTLNLTINDYKRFIRELRRRSDLDIIITSSKADYTEAQFLAQDIANISIFSDKTILDIACLIDYACLFIGPSTGITHIAGNLDKPAICIYPTHIAHIGAKRWGLYLDSKAEYINPNDKSKESERFFSNVPDNFISSMVERVLQRVENG